MAKQPTRGLNAFPNINTMRRRNLSGRSLKRLSRAKWLTIAATVVLILAVASTVGVVGVMAYVSRDLPSPSKLTNREVAQSTKIYDRNGELLYDIFDGEHDRTLLQLKDIPQSVKDATIAAEDANFYEHQGFDVKGIAYALFKDVTSRGISGGGSTITQQLVKNAILNDTSQTPTRKIKELILAIQIEQRYSKDDILQIYLNEIPYGGTAYGIESASHHYFGKSAKDLTLAEAALLAGLPQSPSRYNPLINPEAAYARQHYVLKRMVDTHKITQAQADEASAQKLAFSGGLASNQTIKAPHFVLYVKQLLEEQYGTKLVEQGGLRVTTTLDYKKQQIAEEEVRNQIDRLAKAKANATNAGLIAVDPKTGQILSYVGSEDFNDTAHDGNVDVVQRQRQPGSSIKPITYLTAITKGYTLGTYVGDIPTCFGGEPNYCPGNSDDKFWGPVLPRESLANSRNIPAVKMLQLVGIDNMIAMAHQLGVTSLNDRKDYGLSIGLGAAEISPYDMGQVYATLANQGVRQDLTAILKIEDSTGRVIDEYHQDNGKKIVKPEQDFLITSVLSDNAVRQRLFGPNNKLEIGRPAAAKTGTTNDNKDAWTAGYTPSLSTVVWVGNFDNQPMNGIQGSTGATPIWHNYMQRALQGTPVEQFKQPDNIVSVEIDAVSGMLPGPYTTKRRTELFVKGTEPTQQDTFAKQVKVDKSNGLLANDATIATGNAQDLVCVQLQDEIKAWQPYTDDWEQKMGAPYNCPTKTSDAYHSDSNSPVVQIVNPTNGQTLGPGHLFIKATVASPATVAQVVFLFDGQPVKTLTSIPYEYDLNLDKKITGTHSIAVQAVDANGNQGSQTISVTIGGAGAVGDDAVPTDSPLPTIIGLQHPIGWYRQ